MASAEIRETNHEGFIVKIIGYEELGYAMIEQAYEDYRKLERKGFIKDGKVTVKEWPMRKKYIPERINIFYDQICKVNDLIYFFESKEVDQWLLSNRKSTNQEIEQEAINYTTLNSKSL